MNLIQIKEQLSDNSSRELLSDEDKNTLRQFIGKGQEVACTIKRDNEEASCFNLKRQGDAFHINTSYFVGVDWIVENELAVQVNSKMNDDSTEINYVQMLNVALTEPENFNYLKGLITIKFDKPSIEIQQQKDLLSIFLIIEFINVLQHIVRKGLKKNYITVEKNLHNKVKGRILVNRNINYNLTKGKITDNICRYHIYDIDTPENRILKKALLLCDKQLVTYKNAFDISDLQQKIKYIKPSFENIGTNISTKTIKTYKSNPIFKEYSIAIKFAQLLLHRFGYNITRIGNSVIKTPPFWIDMSKLFELYVFRHLREVFTAKGEISYQVHTNYQRPDFLLTPKKNGWHNPYIIDAKYKPRYSKENIDTNDTRQVAGYARLEDVYEKVFGIKYVENTPILPIKCLIIYPDQDKEEGFSFDRQNEPNFDKVDGYIRIYKVGIRLPEI